MSETMRATFIIPAGGSGVRFGATLPKQFVLFQGEPLIGYTLRRIAPFASEIILSLPEEYILYTQELIKPLSLNVPIHYVKGGATRYESVRNALAISPQEGLVAVHDAVRPFVAAQVIEQLLLEADLKGAAVPFLSLRDSLRQKNENGSCAVDRSNFLVVQTPQVFRAALLCRAYQEPYRNSFTDDCSVYETAFPGAEIALVKGNEENIKITTPLDAFLFDALRQRIE